MTVFLAWVSPAVLGDLPAAPPGPWTEVRIVAPDLALVDSDESLSRVYHELKWSLPDGTALLVSPVTATPKLKGLPPGTTTWLRDRTRPT